MGDTPAVEHGRVYATTATELKTPADFSEISDEAGRKDDAGKLMAGLMLRDFARALLAVSEVTTFGARKYAPSNWLKVPDGQERYDDALFRHLLAEKAGEEYDQESDLLHATHAAWNALALLELKLRAGVPPVQQTRKGV